MPPLYRILIESPELDLKVKFVTAETIFSAIDKMKEEHQGWFVIDAEYMMG